MMSRPSRWQGFPRGRSRKRDISVESATTELTVPARLPGLDVAERIEAPRVASGHWLERASHKRLMVVSGRSNPDLAQKIADRLGIKLGDVTLETFAMGETYCRYEESIRGADLFLVQTGC